MQFLIILKRQLIDFYFELKYFLFGRNIVYRFFDDKGVLFQETQEHQMGKTAFVKDGIFKGCNPYLYCVKYKDGKEIEKSYGINYYYMYIKDKQKDQELSVCNF